MTDPTVPDGAEAMEMLSMDVVPDRADAPVSEITERFLRAILATVPLERIEELHLFAPLRQGGAETGIAVVAARVIEPAVTAVEPLAAVEVSEPVDAGTSPSVDADPSEPVEMIDTVSDGNESVAAEDDIVSDEISAEGVTEEAIAEEVVEDAVAEDAVAEDAVVEDTVVEDAVANEVDAPTSIVRHTVYTARYRLVLKGAERGKWETDVVDEADAPLVTVETVVRGVQRRAGEETEILRYSDRQIARALRMEWPLPVAVPTA